MLTLTSSISGIEMHSARQLNEMKRKELWAQLEPLRLGDDYRTSKAFASRAGRFG